MSHPKERMLPGLTLNPQMTALSEILLHVRSGVGRLDTKDNKVAITSQ